MVNSSEQRLDAVFMALADSTRRGMIRRLSKGSATVGELGRPFAISKPAVTKHVRTLEKCGLIRREKDGRTHRCTVQPKALKQAQDWIEQHRRFWELSLDALALHAEATNPRGKEP